MEELDRVEVAITTAEEPPPSVIEQMMPLIAMVMGIGLLGVMMGQLSGGMST